MKRLRWGQIILLRNRNVTWLEVREGKVKSH